MYQIRRKPIEDLFTECFNIIHLCIWTVLIVIMLQRGCMMLFYAQEPLGGLMTTPNCAFFLGFPECTKRIKPIENLFSDFFNIIYLFIWTYLAVYFSECFIIIHLFIIWTYLIVIILQRGCMMLFYAQEHLGCLRTTPNPALFLGFPECTQKE